METSLTTGIAIAAILLIENIIEKKFSARWRYWVWLLIAIRLVIPFNLSLPKAPVRIEAPEREMVVTYYVNEKRPDRDFEPSENVTEIKHDIEENDDFYSVQETKTNKEQKIKKFPLFGVLGFCWAVGMIVCLFFNLGSYFLFWKKTMLGNSSPTEESKNVFNSLCAEKNIKTIPLYMNHKIESPMLTGFFHPTVLLPNGDYSLEEYRLILSHELTHYKRRDIWYKLLLLFAKSVHWFNPLVHYMCRKAENDLEICCDEEVSISFTEEERQKYCSMILSTVCKKKDGKFLFSTSFYGGKDIIKKRFMSVLYPRVRKGLPLVALAMAVVTLCGAVIVCEPEQKAQKVETHSPLEPVNTIEKEAPPVVGEPDAYGNYPAISLENFDKWHTTDYGPGPTDENETPVPTEPAISLLSMEQFIEVLHNKYPEINDWETIYEETIYKLKYRYDPKTYHTGYVYTPKRFAVLKTNQGKSFDRLIVCEDEDTRVDIYDDLVYPVRTMDYSLHTGWESQLKLGDFSKAEAYETIGITEMGIRFPKENRYIIFTEENRFFEFLDFEYSDNPWIYGESFVHDYGIGTYNNKVQVNEEKYILDLLTDGSTKKIRPYYYNAATKRAIPFDLPKSANYYTEFHYLDKQDVAILLQDYGVYFFDLSSQTPYKPYAVALGQNAGKGMDGCIRLAICKDKKDTFATAYTNGISNEIRFMTFTKDGEILSDFGTGLEGLSVGVTTDCVYSITYHGGIIYFTYSTSESATHYAVDARADHEHILQKDAW